MEDNIFSHSIDLDQLHQDPKPKEEQEEQEEDEEEEEETEEAEEAEEALSLCELPLNTNQNDESFGQEMFKNNRRSSSEPPELFEFFSDVSSGVNMCSAEDIIFCGRLIPFKDHHQSDHTNQMSMKNVISFPEDFLEKQTAFRRRSESLSELQSSSSVSRSGSTKARVMRNSRSLDYQKLRRSSNCPMESPAPSDVDRNSSVKSSGKPDSPPKKPFRPRWSSFLMFGMARLPAEMDLSDIKSRQVRRTPSTLFPAMDSAGGSFPVTRSSSKASWKLLKALSCKDHASVAVAASLCVPHV